NITPTPKPRSGLLFVSAGQRKAGSIRRAGIRIGMDVGRLHFLPLGFMCMQGRRASADSMLVGKMVMAYAVMVGMIHGPMRHVAVGLARHPFGASGVAAASIWSHHN